MSRVETQALISLMGSAEAGGYTLPTDLEDAYRTYTRVRKLTASTPATLDADTAAARIVHAIAAGEAVAPLAAGRELRAAEEDRQAVTEAQRILAVAIDQAGNLATNIASDRTETIITGHLRPALEDVHAKARDAAADLRGYGLDTATLITAPAKARNSYAALSGLVARRKLIYTARRWANTIGNRVPQHDTQGLFAEFADPTALTPGWRQGMRPVIPAPEDPTERLMWAVSDTTAVAKPWIPTVAEQDAAWWAKFGQAHEQRQQAQLDAYAIGARIG